MKKDNSILLSGLEADDFKIDKPVTIYLLRKASAWEIKNLEEVEAGTLKGYTVEIK